MASKLTDAGAQHILNNGAMGGFEIYLITDSVALGDADTLATHTQAVGGGYASGSVASGVVSVVGGIPQVVYEPYLWTFTGPLTGNPNITGYMAMYGTTVVFEETFATAFTPTLNGDSLTVTLKLKLGNGTAT